MEPAEEGDATGRGNDGLNAKHNFEFDRIVRHRQEAKKG